jgi:hypothetical protein
MRLEVAEHAWMGCRCEARQTKASSSGQGTARLARRRLPQHVRLNFRYGQESGWVVERLIGPKLLPDESYSLAYPFGQSRFRQFALGQTEEG